MIKSTIVINITYIIVIKKQVSKEWIPYVKLKLFLMK